MKFKPNLETGKFKSITLTFGHVFVGKSFTNENKIHTIRNSNNPHETKQIPNLSLLRMNSYP